MVARGVRGSRLRRRGAVAVLMTMCLVTLIGVMAIVLDGGMLLAERRYAQGVADSASHAAACTMYTRYSTDLGLDTGGYAKKAALNMAAANGYTNDGTITVVTVNIPPKSGSFLGLTGYVEVIAQRNQSRYFSAIFGTGSLPINARCVARVLSNSQPTIVALDPNGSGALTFNGGFITTNGTIQVNSTSTSAVLSNSGSGKLTAGGIDITGNYSIPSWASTSTFFSTKPATNQPAVADPLASLATPTTSGLTARGSVSTGNGQTVTIGPGVYDGLSIQGGSKVTLTPGMYYIKSGGLNIANGTTVTGTGVTFFMDSSGGAATFGGGANITLTPPTSGTYANIAYFQDRTNAKPINIANDFHPQITGAVYAPAAQINIAGGVQNGYFGTQLITKRINASNNGQFIVNTSSTSGSTQEIDLVE